ncbi:uncharacterized protein PG998_011588 [Apiospora kogelbergensis]|uniref:uncharacterized protein n=1 Tax=Apiospora kogelbergensis TaxID=1337665 RepID=UPI0031325786
MAKSKNRSSRAQRNDNPRTKQSKKRKPVLSCAARDSVTSMPELLELIFTFSSVRQLLVANQRVCKQWRDIIAQSSRLQRMLFFLPEKADDEKDGCRAERLMNPNPLLRDAFQHFFFPDHNHQPSWDLSDLRERVSPQFRMWRWDVAGLAIADMKNGRKRHYAFTRAGASWRSMLVSQPPPKELLLVGRTPASGWPFSPVITRLDGPVRMGTLYDLAYYGSLHSEVVVAWEADLQSISKMWSNMWRGFFQPSSPAIKISSSYNIVLMGGYPRNLWKQQKQVPSQKDSNWERSNIVHGIRRVGEKWMFRCEEYDVEAIDRLIEEAQTKA